MEKNEFFSSTNETDFNFRLAQIYLPYWPLFLITILIGLVTSFIALKSRTPLYIVKGKISLQEPNKVPENKFFDPSYYFGEKKILETEIATLGSVILAQDVVQSLNSYVHISRRTALKTEDLPKNELPLIIKAVNLDKISTSPVIKLVIDWKNKLILMNNKIVRLDSYVIISDNIYKISENSNYAPTSAKEYFTCQIIEPESEASAWVSNLLIKEQSPSSVVFDVTVSTTDPKMGKIFLNKLFSLYNQRAIAEKNSNAFQTLQFIDKRLALVSKELDSLQQMMIAYKASENFYELNKQADSYLTSIQGLETQNFQTGFKKDILDQVEKSVATAPGILKDIPSTTLISDPTLNAMLTRLAESQLEYSKMQVSLGEKNDVLIQKGNEIKTLKANILSNINNIRSSFTNEINGTKRKINETNNYLKTLPKKEVGLLEITRNASVKEALFTYLLQKREETAITSAASIADLKVITNPTIYGPISPIPENYYVTGSIIGFMIAIIMIFIKEKLNNKVLFRTEVEQKTKIPILGELNHANGNDSIVINDGKRSVIAEQFRSIRTNMVFTEKNPSGNKTILITSCISGEGKTFVSLNLAVSISLLKKKVALLELDLRKPKLSKELKVSNDNNLGISDYLSDNASIDDIIKPTNIENVWIIPSGRIPPNPTELISRPALNSMITDLKSKFDFLIIDSAPIDTLSEAQLIAQQSNTTIFVVRHDYTPRIYLDMIKNAYQIYQQKNTFIVFNGLKPRGMTVNASYSGYGYSYGYGYGYGYGYAPEKSKETTLVRIRNFFIGFFNNRV